MIRSLSLLLALAVATSASPTLPTLLHQIAPEDVIGTFRPAAGVGLSCPKNITHLETVNEEGLIPHSAITMNDKQCPDGGSMNIFLSAEDASNAVESADTKRTIESYSESVGAIIYGVELSGRTCNSSPAGTSSFSEGTLVMIFKPETPVSINGVPFKQDRRAMVVIDPEDGICFYNARRQSVSPKPPGSVAPPTTDTAVVQDPSPTPDDGDTDTPGAGTIGTPGAPGTGTGDESGSDNGDETDSDTGDETDSDAGNGQGDEIDNEGDAAGEGSVGEESEPTPEDDGSVCFPADATVELEDGSVKSMAHVQLGDRVKVAHDRFSDVFMFTHKDPTTVYKFVEILSEAGHTLAVTPAHYIYINNALAAASTVKVGDVLQLDCGCSTVVQRVQYVDKQGLYNPQTVHGDIIVNSIRASTYTRSVEPPAAQALMAPLRMLYNAFGWSGSFLDSGADCIADVLPRGQAAF